MSSRGAKETTARTAKAGASRRKAAGAASPRAAPAERPDVVVAPILSNVPGYLLRRAHNAFQTYWMARFRSPHTPITPVQSGMLVVLADNPGLTQTELARLMNVEGPTLMQSIDRLELNGYVQRARRIGDRRSYSLQLTPLGADMVAAIERFLVVRDADLLADLTEDEIKELARLLTKVVSRAHARMKELQDEELAAQPAEPPARRRTGTK
jgi:DNA-binding MarR family transcriptional regulator